MWLTNAAQQRKEKTTAEQQQHNHLSSFKSRQGDETCVGLGYLTGCILEQKHQDESSPRNAWNDKHIIKAILHCHVPDFKYAGFLRQGNHDEYFQLQRRVKINYIGWPFFCVLFNSLLTITFTPGTLYTLKVIALFLHILWDAGRRTHSYQILQHNIPESTLKLYRQPK